MTIPADLDLARRRIEQAERRVPGVLEHLAEQIALIPNLAAAAYDGAGGKSSDHPDPTASTVAARDVLVRHIGYIEDHVASLHFVITALSKACEEALGQRAHLPNPSSNPPPPRDTPRCCGWAGMKPEETCHQIPTARTNIHTEQRVDDGRCIDCGTRHDALQHDVRRARIETNRRRRYHEAR